MTSKLTTIAAGSCGALFALAFVAAPYSCEWGLDAYTLAGAGLALALLILPFVLSAGLSVAGRIGRGIGWAGMACMVWAAGMFVANVRIICRLI